MKLKVLIIAILSTMLGCWMGLQLSDDIPKEEVVAMVNNFEVKIADLETELMSKKADIGKAYQRILELENTIKSMQKELDFQTNINIELADIKKDIGIPVEQQLYTYAICLEYGIDYDLVLAVMHNESGGVVDATNRNRNGTKDSGLMQINSSNHEWLKDALWITDFFNPYQNIRAGAYILSTLSYKYDDVHQVLMAYNMGENRMKELNGKGIYSSKYSRAVVSKMNKLK